MSRNRPRHKKICEMYIKKEKGSVPSNINNRELKGDFAYEKNDGTKALIEAEAVTQNHRKDKLHILGHLANCVIQNMKGENISELIWLCHQTNLEELKEVVESFREDLKKSLGEKQNLLPEINYDTVEKKIIEESRKS